MYFKVCQPIAFTADEACLSLAEVYWQIQIQDNGYLLIWEKGLVKTETSNVWVIIYKLGRHSDIIIYILINLAFPSSSESLSTDGWRVLCSVAEGDLHTEGAPFILSASRKTGCFGQLTWCALPPSQRMKMAKQVDSLCLLTPSLDPVLRLNHEPWSSRKLAALCFL